MSDWTEPCERAEREPYAHDFEPLRVDSALYYAICRKCGIGRRKP